MDKITIADGAHVDVLIDGQTVRLTHIVDEDGAHAIQLSGVDCDLDGELPGLYYPAAHAAVS